jgi:AcrR family transcriptional regulator
LREAAEVFVMEELGLYVVEKSGSRRSSIERREEILNVALSVLAERGYRGASMREIAERAQASKETLYAWFGDKRGLFEELVRWQAERIDAVLVPSLERDADDPSEVLRAFAVELQRLLLGDRAVVINRAAISEAPSEHTFAKVLAAQGRGSIVPKLARYLESQRRDSSRRPHRLSHRRPTGATTARSVADARARADRFTRRTGGAQLSHAVRTKALRSVTLERPVLRLSEKLQ